MQIQNKILAFLFGIIACLSASVVCAETTYPNAVFKLVINKNKLSTYTSFAKKMGFELNKKYTYTEYADIKYKNKIGLNNDYDYLLLSTGGSEWDNAAYERYKAQQRGQCGWETTFYKNYNLTVLHEVCVDQKLVHSWVRILKVDKGRLPDLYKE